MNARTEYEAYCFLAARPAPIYTFLPTPPEQSLSLLIAMIAAASVWCEVVAECFR